MYQDRGGPLSPHLQIYKPQVNSVLSIAHRLSGLILFGVTLGIVLWLWVLSGSFLNYEKIVQHIFTWYGKILAVMVIFVSFYHMINGIRHLFWDGGSGLKSRYIVSSGIAVVFLSVGSTVLYGYCCFRSML